MATTIRRAEERDAQSLARLATETFIETFGRLYREDDLAFFLEEEHSASTYAGLLADPGVAIWIAGAAGEEVGYAMAGPCSLPVPGMPAGAGELSRIYLRRSAQGSGLGGQLLDIALDWLDQRYRPIYLSVWSENVGAQRLYARRGFEKLCEYHFMVGKQADLEWIMERRRPPSP